MFETKDSAEGTLLPLIGCELARMQMGKLARLEGTWLRIPFLSALNQGHLATIGSR